MKKLFSLLFILLFAGNYAAIQAQDSVSVTFRYFPENSVQRVMLPGDFNDFGPNDEGRIPATSPSLMNINVPKGLWYKTVRLEIGGGESTYQGTAGYRYKFHEHYNSNGSQFEWFADPLNPLVAEEGFGDSWLEITHPLIFQMQPLSGAVFQLEVPGISATVAAKNDDPIDVLASKIYINEVEVSNFEGFYDPTLQVLEVGSISALNADLVDGTNKVKIVGVTGEGAEMADSTSFTYIGATQDVDAPRPNGLQDGITYAEDGTSVTFSLFAPGKENVFVIGDFTDWNVELDYQMFRDSLNADSIWFWLEVDNLTPGTEYGMQYLVDGEIRIADPYSELILDEFNDQFISAAVFPNLKAYPAGKTSQLVTVINPGAEEFEWEVTDFEKPANDELVIYELLVRDFIADHSYSTLLDTLDYLENLGINAIEFMPINEFDGNESWGYNPALHGALDKYYGSPESFKRFVDEAHKRGIAIIVDVVLNHSFGQNPIVRLWNEGEFGNPTSDNPYFNTAARHPFNVGYDMNHESAATKYYSKRMMEYWIEEYKVDGFRFDLSKGFTQRNTPNDVGAWGQYDQSRVNIWLDYYNFIRSVDEDAYVILEHFADNSEEKVLADAGMMLWGNMNHEYNEATMGYGSNLNGVRSESRGFNFRHLVSYMESHDEQWLMFKNISFGNSSGDYNVRNLETALDRMELAGAFFFPLPGPKMLWQFGELGYGYGNAGEQCLRDSPDCPTAAPGRTANKPIRWDYFEDQDRIDLYNTWASLITLRRSSEAFTRPESTFYALDGNVKYYRFTHSDTDVVAIGNFGVTSTTQNVDFTTDGTWYDYFGDNEVTVNNQVLSVDLAPGEFKIYTTKAFNTLVSNENETSTQRTNAFTLHQNYPNPFNPSTNIKFDVAETGLVTLEVYNLLGQKVAELVNDRKVAGTYTVRFDAGTLSSGIYIARLSSGNTVQIQKMTLLK